MSIVELIKKHTPGLVPFLMGVRNGTFKTMDKWPLEKLIAANQRHYKHRMGYSFDIKHPKLFTEKIQWYKFFYEHPDINRITDKVRFKEYIKEKLGEGYTIPMYGAWDNVCSLEEEWNKKEGALPEQFVLKANLQSDDNGIKFIHEKNKVAFDSIKHEMESWLEIKNTLMNSCDRRFYMSQPMILAEKFMTDGTDRLTDYKFFCFNGKPYCVYVDFEHSILFYDMDWNKLDVKYGHYQNDGDIKCPKTFCEMKNIAEKLSEGFPFVRVDLYSIDDKVYAGEMTFNPGGGFTHYYPVSFNEKLGEMFKLPIK